MSSDAPVCPATETLCGWVEGRLEADDRAALEEHLDACPACRRAVAEVGRVMGAADADTPAARGHTPSRRQPSAPPGTMPPSGAPRLGRYEIRREIGMGGMGVVYEGFDPALRRRIALKLLRPDKALSDRAGFTERLAAEARALAKISHPNVLTVFDVGVDGDTVFLAAEYVEGVTMDAGWPHRARGWRERLEAYLQAARGLAAIHGAGLTHRDIKPSNILLGDDGRVRITDFGLAVGWDEQAAPAGTPAYMAPEQLAGKAGPAADQFALAMCMVEALNGARPSLGAVALDLEKKGSSVWAGSAPPRAVWEALGQAISPKADDRFATIDVFIDTLANAIAPGPPSRRAAPPSRPAGAATSRGGVAAYAALAVALLAGGIAVASALRSPTSPGAATPSAAAEAAHVQAPPPGTASAAALPPETLPSAEGSADAPSNASAKPVPGGGPVSTPGPAAPAAVGPPPAPAAAATFDPSDPLAGLKKTIAVSDKVNEATTALRERDGKKCLQKLDEAAAIDAEQTSSYDLYRAQCEMLAGRCEQGVARIKRSKTFGQNADALAEQFRSMYCPASSVSSPKDKLKSIWLQAAQSRTADECKKHEAQLKQVLASFGSEKPDTTAVAGAWSAVGTCWVNAGDCTEARRIVAATMPADRVDAYMENWIGGAKDRLCKK